MSDRKFGLGDSYRNALGRFVPVMLVGAIIWAIVVSVVWKIFR